MGVWILDGHAFDACSGIHGIVGRDQRERRQSGGCILHMDDQRRSKLHSIVAAQAMGLSQRDSATKNRFFNRYLLIFCVEV